MPLDLDSSKSGLPSKTDRIVTVISVVYCFFEIAYALGLLRTQLLHLYPGTFRSLILATILILTFILRPARTGKARNSIPWYDYLLMIASLPGPLYMAWAYIELIPIHPYFAEPFEQVLGVLTALVVLEATRRTVGWIICVIGITFIGYALFGHLLPGVLHTKAFPFNVVIAEIFLFPNGMFGFVLNIIAVTIFMFILFGAFLQVTGGAEVITSLALATVGYFRGGPAKVSVIASGLFGTMSGSAVANVAVDGAVTIPMMQRVGFSPAYAGAIEAVASTGGMLMPPVMGAVAFIMAEFLGIAYKEVAIAAALPAILYYLGLYATVDFYAAKNGLRGMDRSELPSLIGTIRKGWPFILPLPALIYFLTIYTEVTSCAYATGVLLIGAMIKKESRLTLQKILDSLVITTRTMVTITPVVAMIGIILGCLSMTGLGINLSRGLVALAHGNLLILLILSAATSFIMGMGLTATVCYILLATLVAPALTAMGVPPLAAHLFMFYWGMLFMITPPFALAVYVASGIANASMMKTGYAAMRMAVAAYIVPFMWIYKPSLLLRGSLFDITVTFFTSAIGIIIIAGVLEGYLLTSTNWPQRVLLGGGGLLLIAPGWIANVIGAGCLIVGILWQWADLRTARSKTYIPGISSTGAG